MPRREYTILTVGVRPERFEEVAANHAKWWAVASHLFAAAEVLWPTIDAAFRASGEIGDDPAPAEGLRYRGPFYLLVGLAVENFAKALIVQAKNRRGEPVTNGDVLFVKWRRRFPVPKRRADVQQATTTSTTDIREIRKLFERLEKQYRTETRGWGASSKSALIPWTG